MTKNRIIQICIALITALAVYIGGVLSSEMVNPLLTLSKAEARYLTQQTAKETYVTIADFNLIKGQINSIDTRTADQSKWLRDIYKKIFPSKVIPELNKVPVIAKGE